MTIAEELANRNGCRNGLQGVFIVVNGYGSIMRVESTRWSADMQLRVTVTHPDVGTWEIAADRCELCSPWPVVCCTPKRHNEWNSDGRKWRVAT